MNRSLAATVFVSACLGTAGGRDKLEVAPAPRPAVDLTGYRNAKEAVMVHAESVVEKAANRESCGSPKQRIASSRSLHNLHTNVDDLHPEISIYVTCLSIQLSE